MAIRRSGTQQIDWPAVRERLKADAEALERNFTPLPEQQQRILRERAQRLAAEPRKEQDPGEQVEVLEFAVAGERYAFATHAIGEVHALRELTTLPGTPPFVLGIAHVRGRVLSVIDLRRFFELPEKGLTQLNKVIVLRSRDADSGGMEFGVLADDIVGVAKLAKADLQEPLPTLTGIRAEYLCGVTAGRLALLDADKLLNDDGIIVNEEVTA